MKLKHYLTLSHLMMLITTIVCVIIGIEISSLYNIRTKVKDDLSARMEFVKYRDILSNPNLYNGTQSITEALSGIELNEEVVITLYTPSGLTLYSSVSGSERKVALDALYSNLNEVTYQYNIYMLKKPVFNNES